MEEELFIQDYLILNELGSGSYATVYKARHTKTDVIVAMKIIPKEILNTPEAISTLQSEIELFKKLDHPFIAHFFENFEDEYNYYIVMEYLEKGDLLDEINRSSGIREEIAYKYISQICAALEYLHCEMHVIHRDIKAENIMLDKYKNVRLVDFGMSGAFSIHDPLRDTICGSYPYASPEMLRNEQYTASTDIWSLGILLYLLLFGALPFQSSNTALLIKLITTKEPIIPIDASLEVKDLLRRILVKDPSRRITIQEIKSHPWVNKFNPSITFSFDFGSSYSYSSFHHISINKKITTKLEKFGYDVSGLQADVLSGCVSKRTAAYKMIRRQKIAKRIFIWISQKARIKGPVTRVRALSVHQLLGKKNSFPNIIQDKLKRIDTK